MSTNNLVGYQIQFGGTEFKFNESAGGSVGSLYSYLLAGNGVFLRASRPEMIVQLPIADCEIRGLNSLEPTVIFNLPRVPARYLEIILAHSVIACARERKNVEALFHLIWLEGADRWRLDEPEQIADGASVRPTDDSEGSSYQLALIEVHSHHNMDAFFSGTDDADEQGFRIYGVIGNIFTEPKLRVRVGCYGYFYEVPAETIFEMPVGIADALEAE
jgi:PRTRC genetic system protein A